MYSPVHATAGLLLATVMPDPITAFLVGAGSHYLLDTIPHGDTNFGTWLTGGHAARRIATVEAVDLGLSAIMVLGLIANHPGSWWVTLVAGAVGSITPDVLWGLRFVLKSQGWNIPWVTSFLQHHDRWHAWGHTKHPYDIPFTVGLILQGLLLFIVLFLQA